jgi:hypothetical protein
VSRLEGYPDMVRDLLTRHLKSHTHLLMEGNTVVRHLSPDIRLFIVNPFLPPTWWKNDIESLSIEADFVIVNSFPPETQVSAQKAHPSVQAALDQVKTKCVEMESLNRLDLWQDRRIYQTISTHCVA